MMNFMYTHPKIIKEADTHKLLERPPERVDEGTSKEYELVVCMYGREGAMTVLILNVPPSRLLPKAGTPMQSRLQTCQISENFLLHTPGAHRELQLSPPCLLR